MFHLLYSSSYYIKPVYQIRSGHKDSIALRSEGSLLIKNFDQMILCWASGRKLASKFKSSVYDSHWTVSIGWMGTFERRWSGVIKFRRSIQSLTVRHGSWETIRFTAFCRDQNHVVQKTSSHSILRHIGKGRGFERYSNTINPTAFIILI
jgi:hypothetical protein